MHAIPVKNIEMIAYLLSKDADATAMNIYQETPVGLAIQTRDAPTIIAILLRAIERNQLEHNGVSLLIYASLLKMKGIIESLVEKGINIDVADPSGHTALHYLCQHETTPEEYAINEALARLLINAKADVNAADVEGLTPLITASQNGAPISLWRRISLVG